MCLCPEINQFVEQSSPTRLLRFLLPSLTSCAFNFWLLLPFCVEWSVNAARVDLINTSIHQSSGQRRQKSSAMRIIVRKLLSWSGNLGDGWKKGGCGHVTFAPGFKLALSFSPTSLSWSVMLSFLLA